MITPVKGQYSYHVQGRHFRIYRITRCTTGPSCYVEEDPVPTEPYYLTEAEARRRVYQLNGWGEPCPAVAAGDL